MLQRCLCAVKGSAGKPYDMPDMRALSQHCEDACLQFIHSHVSAELATGVPMEMPRPLMPKSPRPWPVATRALSGGAHREVAQLGGQPQASMSQQTACCSLHEHGHALVSTHSYMLGIPTARLHVEVPVRTKMRLPSVTTMACTSSAGQLQTICACSHKRRTSFIREERGALCSERAAALHATCLHCWRSDPSKVIRHRVLTCGLAIDRLP